MSAKKIKGTLPGRFHQTGPGNLDARAFTRWYRDHTVAQWESLNVEAIVKIAETIETARDAGRTVYVMGNGGSAATAAHIATDLSKTAAAPGHTLIKCVSLADNTAFITAIGNDLSFDDIFSRQLENLLVGGDVVLLISGSGNSPNLIKAAKLGRARSATVIALLGFDGGKLKDHVDIALTIPSDQYGVIEDLHLSIGHILTFYLKQRRGPSTGSGR